MGMTIFIQMETIPSEDLVSIVVSKLLKKAEWYIDPGKFSSYSAIYFTPKPRLCGVCRDRGRTEDITRHSPLQA